jgi:hypothetical protein
VSTIAPEKSKPSRFERLEAAVAARRQKRAELVASIDQLTVEEAGAVQAVVRDGAEGSAYKLGSPAQQLREKRHKLEATLAGLESELRVQEAELAPAQAEQPAAELKAATKRAASLNRREAERIKRAGERLAEMAEDWNAIAEILGERSQLISQVGLARLVERAEFSYAEEVAAFHAAGSVPHQPVPTTFAAFLDRLVSVAVERPPDEDAEARRATNRHRVAAGLQPEPDPPPPSELASLLPDLRGRDKRAEVSPQFAAIMRSADEAGSAWPGGDF